MARMIPSGGPASTDSQRAEPDVYWRLARQLSDEYCVIHSLPWLSAVAHEIDQRAVPTGEIDFLILHPELGLLAIEVKGGVVGYDKNEFVYVRTRERIDPIRQVRRGTHSLARWIMEQSSLRLKIGYILLFPDSELGDKPLPPALIDPTVTPATKIAFDKRDLQNLGSKIYEVMKYWKSVLDLKPLGRAKIDQLIDLICPITEYYPSWQTRIEDDGRTWLRLTPEQAACLKILLQKQRIVVTGWPGTGKTLLAVSIARLLANQDKRVLFLVYNVALTNFLRNELADNTNVTVVNFHGLCRQASQLLQRPITTSNLNGENLSSEWYKIHAPQMLQAAINGNLLLPYDALIVDEAQVFQLAWWDILTKWMDGKKILAFCDETQVFDFEESTSTDQITEVINAPSSFVLTVNLRSPLLVFERLQEVRDSSYQQHNPRPRAFDTLTELVSADPVLDLLKTVKDLLNEGVPGEAITIVYISSEPPQITDHRGLSIRTEYIAKFRGLESPIVIVWAPDNCSDILLFCAYSRATSRCIVIYSISRVAANKCGKFGQILLESEKGIEIREWYAAGQTSNIVKQLELKKTNLVVKTANIAWYPKWAALAVEAEKELDVNVQLWLDHLCLTTNYPIYFWHSELRGEIVHLVSPKNVADHRKHKTFYLIFCERCHNTTFHTSALENGGLRYYCQDCQLEEYHGPLPLPTDLHTLVEFDKVLFAPTQSPLNLKQKMTVSLIALGRWRSLDGLAQNALMPVVGGGSIGYEAALVLVAVDIARAKSGEELVLHTLAERYYRWCPTLSQQVTFEKWRSMVANALATWKQREWLRKKGPGIYSRIKFSS